MKAPKLKISAQQVQDAINYRIWDIGNGVLYDLWSHRPIFFPIYDSRAVAAVRCLSPDTRFVSPIAATAADREYRDFCSRVAWILDEVKNTHRTTLLPPQVDNLFLRLVL